MTNMEVYNCDLWVCQPVHVDDTKNPTEIQEHNKQTSHIQGRH